MRSPSRRGARRTSRETEHLAGEGPGGRERARRGGRRRARGRINEPEDSQRHGRLPAWRRLGVWVPSGPSTHPATRSRTRRARAWPASTTAWRPSTRFRRPCTTRSSVERARGSADTSSRGTLAGGNLAATVARHLREQIKLPAADLPRDRRWRAHTVLCGSSASATASPPPAMQRFWDLYLANADGIGTDASPLRGDGLSGRRRPPTSSASSHDVLRDEGEAYAHALEQAGVDGHAPCALSSAPIHGFWRWQTHGRSPRARACARRRAAVRSCARLTRRMALLAPVRRHGRGVPQRARDRARGGGGGSSTPRSERYLDGTASLWYANLGHGREGDRRRRRGADAARSRPTTRSRDISATAPRTSCASGSPRARRCPNAQGLPHQRRRRLDRGRGQARPPPLRASTGQPERVHLISRTQGYHGTHGFGTVARRHRGQRRPTGARSSRRRRSVPYDSLPALEAEIRRVGPDKVAAFFCEPVIGAGGVLLAARGLHPGRRRPLRRARHPARDRLRDLRLRPARHLVRRRALGGRHSPTMITFAKGVTSGYLPLGGVVVDETRSPRRTSRQPGGPMLRHGATYAGHPAVCAAGARGARHLRARGPDPRAAASSSGRSRDALAPLADHPAVGEVRGGLGFLAAVARRRRTRTPAPPPGWPRGAREAGVLVRAAARRRRGLAAADLRAGAHRPAGRRRSRPAWTM